MLHLTQFACFVYLRPPASSFPLLALSVSRSLALALLPSCPLSPIMTSTLLSLFTPFLSLFSGPLSFFLWFSHASAGYERIVFGGFMGEWEREEWERKERERESRSEGLE